MLGFDILGEKTAGEHKRKIVKKAKLDEKYFLADEDLEFEDLNLDRTLCDFIKQKAQDIQSSVEQNSILAYKPIEKRCGVSFVVETESKQRNVNGYEPLNHYVIQGSSTINSFSLDSPERTSITQIVRNLLASKIILTSFKSNQEREMRNYVLYSFERAEIAENKAYLAFNFLKEGWKFTKNESCLIMNFQYDPHRLLRSHTDSSVLSFIQQSDVWVTILFKPQKGSVSSILKCYGKEADIKNF